MNLDLNGENLTQKSALTNAIAKVIPARLFSQDKSGKLQLALGV